jgi:DNA-binding NarL/FixJ family response regulator/anti-sigma regulatory factor (Ser/Thr protein kinase)
MALDTLPVAPAARPQIRVAVVDDNPGFRETLASLLGTEELVVVGAVGRGSDAVNLVRSTGPDVVLMDVRMPEMNGIEATRLLKSAFPDVGIVALTGVDDQDAVREMLVAGASCYVLKDSDSEEIFHAIRQAAAGGGVISSEVTPRVIGELTEALERERRRARQLELAQEALLERAARRHELLSRLGHELRTPVTVILGMAQTLSKGTGTSEQRDEMLAALVMRAQGLARLVSRLEGVVEAGLTEYTDVIDVADEVARISPRVRVESPARPMLATLNRVAAARILEELVENGLEFSGERDPVVIRITGSDTGIEVRVIDVGPGVSEDALERIFEPLEQAEELHTRTHQGVGLGLTVARMSARAMDGDVTLEQTSPAGSVFLWRVSTSPFTDAPSVPSAS